MNKGKLNFIIDVIMFVLMGAVAGLGLLIKYVLISGAERWVKYGRNINLTLCGLDRHDWGEIHLILGIILIGLLILHIILHWKMIVCLYKKVISNNILRIVCTLLFVLFTLILVCFPFFIQVDVQEIDSGINRFKSTREIVFNQNESNYSKKEIEDTKEQFHPNKLKEIKRHKHDSSVEVRGFMTIQEISDKCNIPCEKIKEKLNIPKSVSNYSTLGQLKKQYGFKMSDIEKIIIEN